MKSITEEIGGNMAKNDVLALESNFNTWTKDRMPGLVEIDPKIKPFEYYCVDQFLKPFALSDEELISGLVAGGNDGGNDAVYFFVGRRLMQEDSDLDPKSDAKVNLLIIQTKETQGFSLPEIDKLTLFTDDLLDLGRETADYHTTYNSKLLGIIKVFKDKYQQIAGNFPAVNIGYYYITKADVVPNKDAEKAAKRVTEKAKAHLSASNPEFHFINARELWKQVQLRPSKTKVIEWYDAPLSSPEGLVGLVHIQDYWKFLQDEHGELHESIFESNVRGFQQRTPVNVSIYETLNKPGKADFWTLNNGITILTRQTDSAGHKKFVIHDPQIVNGLQTSRQIFEYFRKPKSVIPDKQNDNRRILVRVLQSSDEKVRDDIIRATNSQNTMPAEALRATNPIHYQIEQLFGQYDLFYDRRKGYYKDQGKPIAKIVSILDLLQATLAIAVKRPDDARGRPRDYVKHDDKHAMVFGEEDAPFSLVVYLKCIHLYRRVAAFLASSALDLDSSHQRNIRPYLAMYVAAAAVKSPYIPAGQLATLDIAGIEESLILDCYNRVRKQYDRLSKKFVVDGNPDFEKLAKGTDLLKALTSELKRRFKASSDEGLVSLDVSTHFLKCASLHYIT